MMEYVRGKEEGFFVRNQVGAGAGAGPGGTLLLELTYSWACCNSVTASLHIIFMKARQD